MKIRPGGFYSLAPVLAALAAGCGGGGGNGGNVVGLPITLDPLQGTYAISSLPDTYISFFSDGSYVLGVRSDDSSCPSNGNGVQVNNYDWDASSGAISIYTPSVNSVGDCGLGGPGDGTLVKNADGSLTLSGAKLDHPLTLVPVTSTAGSLIGSFQEGGSGTSSNSETPAIVTFLDASHYYLESTDISSGATPGIESGCYSVDPSTRKLSVNLSSSCKTAAGKAAIDTNGDGGFSDISTTATLTVTGANTLELTDDSDSTALTRIPVE